MPELVFLGTANAIPDERHENTHMAVVYNEQFVLIDCVNNPTVRLKQAGLNAHKLSDLILTHFHPDHVSGVPSLLMNSWLLGRRQLLNIYGLAHTIQRIEKLMDSYEWHSWPNFYPVVFHTLPEQEMAPVLENADLRISASPVCHMVPTIGLRIESPQTGQVVAYSCDTEPCPQVIRLADQAAVLIHEATGASFGHTSASQAGEIARKAGAKRLYLIHYHTGPEDPGRLVAEASQTFGGPVALAEDFLTLQF